MGLFDSGKKETISDTGQNALPLPPPPPKAADKVQTPIMDIPKPVQLVAINVPLPKPHGNLNGAPTTINLQKTSVLQKDAGFSFDIPQMPTNAGRQDSGMLKNTSGKVPESLPILPPLSRQDTMINQDLAKFSESNLYEEIPFFKDTMPDLSDLPLLDVTDSEDFRTLHDARHSTLSKPLFVRTDQYSEVLSTIDTIKIYVAESGEMIYSLENLKKNVEIEHKNYKESLEDIQRKLIYIDKVLFEREGEHA